MNTTILAIDPGKYNCVLCWYEPDVRCDSPLSLREMRDQRKNHPDAAR